MVVNSRKMTLTRQRVVQNLRARLMDGSWLIVAAATLVLIAVAAGGH